MQRTRQYITVLPPILGTMIPWGIMGIEIPVMVMGVVVGLCGLLGGAINIAGRGPLVAGAFIGLLIGLGGYGAVAWWIHDRTSVRKYELLIAFALGAAPGMLMQYVLQLVLKKRAASGK